ncbi:MAG: oxidoreductase domain protein [Paenibacillaceae bacterium]|jgi:predicted dehydrogenase|nr:oxidoreductase domain protein [Paenibacillaceae bacterium]
MAPIRAALIGIGGYGKEHIRVLTKLAEEGKIQCTAFCDPNPAAFPEQADLLVSLGAKHYEDYRVMLDSHAGIDLAIIATPIPLHKPMFIHAMARGIHVLTEKPPCVAIEDLDEMATAAKQSGKLGAVNFQNTSGQAFRLLLKMIREGAIGQVRTVTGTGMYLRLHQYFQRAQWAGKLTLNGDYVLDGPTLNALSHQLNNCLVAAGGGDPRLSQPRTVQAELYRCNDIESEDTSCIRIETENGVLLHNYTTLSSSQTLLPVIKVTGTEGEMVWSYENHLTVINGHGESRNEVFPKEDLVRNMYDNLLDAISGGAVPLYSSIQDCRSFILAANGAFTSSGVIHPIPQHALAQDTVESGRTYTHIPLISTHIEQAAGQGKLFSELPDIPWGASAKPVNMENYKRLLIHTGTEHRS